jgi:hypothetical protein
VECVDGQTARTTYSHYRFEPYLSGQITSETLLKHVVLLVLGHIEQRKVVQTTSTKLGNSSCESKRNVIQTFQRTFWQTFSHSQSVAKSLY